MLFLLSRFIYWIVPQEFKDVSGKPTILINNKALIKKFKEIHGDLYNYSKVKHSQKNNPATFFFKKHGEFNQKPPNHLQAKGCPDCGDKIRFEKNRLTPDEIL